MPLGCKGGPGRPPREGRFTIRNLPPHLFSRRGLYDRLGVSLGLVNEKAVTDLLWRGIVKAVARTTNNQPLYDDSSVEQMLAALREDEARKNRPPDHFNVKTFSTEDSLTVYAGLEAGKTMVQIALENKIDPRHVEVITAKYCQQAKALTISREGLRKINARLAAERSFIDDDGNRVEADPIATEEELIEELTAVVGKIARKKACIRCRKEARCEECELCVIKKIERMIQKQMTEHEATQNAPADSGPQVDEESPSSNAAE